MRVSVAAGARDRELYTAEAKFATAKEEHEFYMASLQQLTLFKSRSERALLDTQSRAESAAREAQEARARYEKARDPPRPSPSLPLHPRLRPWPPPGLRFAARLTQPVSSPTPASWRALARDADHRLSFAHRVAATAVCVCQHCGGIPVTAESGL